MWSRRPFSSFENFVGTMCQFIDDLPQDGKAGILRSFLDLTARWESLSCDSQREQTETGIRKLINDEEYQNICGTKFSRYLFSARSEFGIFIVFFNEVFSSYVIRVNCVSYISCCQSVCSSFGSATPHATTLFCLT